MLQCYAIAYCCLSYPLIKDILKISPDITFHSYVLYLLKQVIHYKIKNQQIIAKLVDKDAELDAISWFPKRLLGQVLAMLS